MKRALRVHPHPQQQPCTRVGAVHQTQTLQLRNTALGHCMNITESHECTALDGEPVAQANRWCSLSAALTLNLKPYSRQR